MKQFTSDVIKKIIENRKTKYSLYIIFAAYFIISAIILIITPQKPVWDAGLCIKMTDNVYRHIPFNHYAHPNPQNLDKDESEFVSWWSPGQFALPLWIKTTLSIKLGSAVKILIMLCMLIASLGIYNLFKILIEKKNQVKNEAATLSLIFLLFTVLQPFFWENIFRYDGGGILILAYAPWFIYWVIRLDRINLYNMIFLLLLALAGFFLKTAFTGIFLGALLYLFLGGLSFRDPFESQNFKQIIRNGVRLFIVFIAYILIIKFAFLDHSRNIGDSSLGIRLQPRVLFYPITAPVMGIFSLDFLNRTYQWILAAIVAIPAYYLILRSSNLSPMYKKVLIGFCGTAILFFIFLYFLNVDVSYEPRHYRLITILFTPAIFLSLSERRVLNYFTIILAISFTLINVYRFSTDILNRPTGQVYTFSGFISGYPNNLIKKIHSLDNFKNKGKDIFYFSSSEPEIALEVKNNRVLLEDNFINFHFDNQARFKPVLYFGRNSGNIYVIYPISQFKQDSASYLTRFEKYKKFEKIYQSDGYAIYKAILSNG